MTMTKSAEVPTKSARTIAQERLCLLNNGAMIRVLGSIIALLDKEGWYWVRDAADPKDQALPSSLEEATDRAEALILLFRQKGTLA